MGAENLRPAGEETPPQVAEGFPKEPVQEQHNHKTEVAERSLIGKHQAHYTRQTAGYSLLSPH